MALPSPETLDRLKAVVGPAGWTDDPDRLAPHLVEWRDRHFGQTPLMLSPASTEEVAAIVRICAETETALTPQGGNTGVVGGQIPHATGCSCNPAHHSIDCSTTTLSNSRAR